MFKRRKGESWNEACVCAQQKAIENLNTDPYQEKCTQMKKNEAIRINADLQI